MTGAGRIGRGARVLPRQRKTFRIPRRHRRMLVIRHAVHMHHERFRRYLVQPPVPEVTFTVAFGDGE